MNELTEVPAQDEQLPDFVEIIASGYEWVCPNCDNLNKEIEILERVKCPHCGNLFFTNPPEHAHQH